MRGALEVSYYDSDFYKDDSYEIDWECENRKTFEDVVEQWLSVKWSDVRLSTVRNYETLLKPLYSEFSEKKMEEITAGELQSYFNKLIDLGHYSTARHLFDLLKALYRYAYEKGEVSLNPMNKIVIKNVGRCEAKYLTELEQKYFVLALENNRLKYLFLFALYTGLRPGEICGLQWPQVDIELKTIRVENSVRRQDYSNGSRLELGNTKTGKVREIPLGTQAMNCLLQQLKLQAEESVTMRYSNPLKLVFTTRKGTVLENNSINRSLKSIQKKMKELYVAQHKVSIDEVPFEEFTVKAFRHTYATRALESGVPLKVVSDLLGHSSVRITGDVYTHVNSKTMQKNIVKIDEYLNSVESYINSVCLGTTQKDIQK